MGVAGVVRTAGVGCVLAALGAISSGLAAQPALSSLQGAWLDPSLSCESVFSRAGKGASFKQPVDVFAPAFIISGNRIRTPMASCRIKGTKPIGDHRALILDCATSVAVSETSAILERSPDGSLKRFSSDQDQVGRTYKQCNL